MCDIMHIAHIMLLYICNLRVIHTLFNNVSNEDRVYHVCIKLHVLYMTKTRIHV